ncbi:MAG: VRR-NUC domain-containing protein [Bacteroidales bacterium]|nr:VRR-NUC domain-containing protein [Bacteroidales bacterium]
MRKKISIDLAKELGLVEAEPSSRKRRPSSEEEYHLQCNCVKWFRLQYPRMKHNLFAVPNGGGRGKADAGKLKAEGVLSGVSDLILLKRNTEYGGLMIEMKTKKGVQADSQKDWQEKISKDGYKYVVCRSLEDFMREVNEYLSSS